MCGYLWTLASKICDSKASADVNGTFGPAVDKRQEDVLPVLLVHETTADSTAQLE